MKSGSIYLIRICLSSQLQSSYQNLPWVCCMSFSVLFTRNKVRQQGHTFKKLSDLKETCLKNLKYHYHVIVFHEVIFLNAVFHKTYWCSTPKKQQLNMVLQLIPATRFSGIYVIWIKIFIHLILGSKTQSKLLKCFILVSFTMCLIFSQASQI